MIVAPSLLHVLHCIARTYVRELLDLSPMSMQTKHEVHKCHELKQLYKGAEGVQLYVTPCYHEKPQSSPRHCSHFVHAIWAAVL